MNEPFISADDHVMEHPDVWTSRMSKARWGDRIPHLEAQPDGGERWIADGKPLPLAGAACAGALMPDRIREPQRWAEVPLEAYSEVLFLMNYQQHLLGQCLPGWFCLERVLAFSLASWKKPLFQQK